MIRLSKISCHGDGTDIQRHKLVVKKVKSELNRGPNRNFSVIVIRCRGTGGEHAIASKVYDLRTIGRRIGNCDGSGAEAQCNGFKADRKVAGCASRDGRLAIVGLKEIACIGDAAYGQRHGQVVRHPNSCR